MSEMKMIGGTEYARAERDGTGENTVPEHRYTEKISDTDERTETEKLRDEVISLRSEVADLKRYVSDPEDPIELLVLPEDAVRAHITDHISFLKDGDEIYPADVALKYGIDMKCVTDVMEKMLAEGIFR